MKNISYQNVLGTYRSHLSANEQNKIRLLIENRSYLELLNFLNSMGCLSDEASNLKGVCLMRLNRAEEAVGKFRSFVLQEGCTWMKPELPIIYRTNFATALLLSDNMGGFLSTFYEIKDRAHPAVMRLEDAIRHWEQNLSLGKKLCWKVGIVPAAPLRVSFDPGDFYDPVAAASNSSQPNGNNDVRQTNQPLWQAGAQL